MQKKSFCTAFMAFVLATLGASAQTNIQEMYDFNRGHLTTTLEMFKADKWGSTFFFNDIYHPTDGIDAPTGYYTEISRALNFWQGSKLGAMSLHVEWNGGMFAHNAWLFGAEYFLHSADYRNTFTFELMYKTIKSADQTVPIQFTFVWGMNDLLGVKGLVFSGFLDIWGEDVTWVSPSDPMGEETKLVLLSEPQVWYNVGRHFGCENLFVGGEVELAYNFSGGWRSGADFHKNKGFNAAPCLGVKWVF